MLATVSHISGRPEWAAMILRSGKSLHTSSSSSGWACLLCSGGEKNPPCGAPGQPHSRIPSGKPEDSPPLGSSPAFRGDFTPPTPPSSDPPPHDGTPLPCP